MIRSAAHQPNTARLPKHALQVSNKEQKPPKAVPERIIDRAFSIHTTFTSHLDDENLPIPCDLDELDPSSLLMVS